jgi:predicted O-methyltransferase YrrM
MLLERAKNISGWMSETELAFLHTVALSIPDYGKVVEIGSWKGRSTVAICEALKQKNHINLYAVDTFAGDPEILKDGYQIENDEVYEEFQKNTADYPFLTTIRTTSAEASQQFEDESLDWIFIDADHSYDAVCNDVRFWFRKLKYGGILSGHDYPKVAVKRAINTLFGAVNVWDSIWYLKRDRHAPQHRLIPAIEVATRRLLLHQKF